MAFSKVLSCLLIFALILQDELNPAREQICISLCIQILQFIRNSICTEQRVHLKGHVFKTDKDITHSFFSSFQWAAPKPFSLWKS